MDQKMSSWNGRSGRCWSQRNWRWLLLLSSISHFNLTSAANVEFRNCLDDNIVQSTPQLLQFVPLNVSAILDTSSKERNLNVTVYGNVTGRAFETPLPPPTDPVWSSPTYIDGKIPDLDNQTNIYTTLFGRFDVLSYSPYAAPPTRFCNSTLHGTCPLAPAFFVDPTDLEQLPSFSISHDMFSSYAFTSITATMQVRSGNENSSPYACITAVVTPDLGGSLKGLIRYLPLAILLMVGTATVAASILSPWSSSDIFLWSSNFGRDEDILRLVTPGFADCLQYIQFIVLTSSLTLSYPGYLQPVVSNVAWSALMFNESLVTNGNGSSPIVDGIYQYGNTSHHGLERMSNLVGMTSDKDIWAGMMVWIVVISAAVAVLTQIGFVMRWIYRQLAHVPAEDLRSKNGPFTAGNLIRTTVNLFSLPLLALSFYQLVIARKGPTYAVALAAIVIVMVLAFSVRLFFLFMHTRPRSFLFDDLVTLLAYGPLYNTYCDDAAIFALVPIAINILRGIAIGAVQASGVAQVILLAISEIILILTINAFRPFPSATSMNIYHTCFSIIRLITIFLSISFIPSLGVTDASKGWIGYAILLIHACVLVFGFFLNAVQTLVEVIARLAGAGGHSDADGGAARGGLVKVFGMRQLSRRVPRHSQQLPRTTSMASDAAMLSRMESAQKDMRPTPSRTRTRSISASSTMLLDSAGRSPNRLSQNLDGFSGGQLTPDASSTMSHQRMTKRASAQSPGAIVGLSNVESKDPYYRPPRRNTMDALSSPLTRESAEWAGPKAGLIDPDSAIVDDDVAEASAAATRGDAGGEGPADNSKSQKDYAVREVDFYYGVRGPALSSGTRKLKTGPADPTGTVSSATGWFKSLLGGKTNDGHKGFEVVRSARAPLSGRQPPPLGLEPGSREPYRDVPENAEIVAGNRAKKTTRFRTESSAIVDDDASVSSLSDDERPVSKIAARPPSLPLIDTVGGIELPSRIGSEKSKKSRRRQPSPSDLPSVPAIPRKSSRRNSSRDLDESPMRSSVRLSTVEGSPSVPRTGRIGSGTSRLPFDESQPSAANVERHAATTTPADLKYGDHENLPQRASYTRHLRDSSSALGDHAAGDRPSSLGFVSQHRASDNIYHSPDSPEFEGSVAQVFPGPGR